MVEIKRHRGIVDTKTVLALYGVMTAREVHRGVVITTGGFGSSSRDFAYTHGIHLVDGIELVRLLAQYLNVEAYLDDTAI